MTGYVALAALVQPRAEVAYGALDFVVAALACIALGMLIYWMIQAMRSVDQSGARRELGLRVQAEAYQSELARIKQLLADSRGEVIASRETIANLQRDVTALRANCEYLELIRDDSCAPAKDPARPETPNSESHGFPDDWGVRRAA